MKIWAIVDPSDGTGVTIGYLLYFVGPKAFYIEICRDLTEEKAPLLLSSFVKRGKYTIDRSFALKWVQNRIVPTDRQNLGMILRDNRLSEYDEEKLLSLSKGKCAQDDCFLKRIPEDRIPEELLERLRRKIEEFYPLKDSIVVAFSDGMTRKIPYQEFDLFFSAVKESHGDKYRASLKVEPGGFGLSCCGNTVPAEVLREAGETLPLSAEDLRMVAERRLADTAMAAEMLSCTRQNLAYLAERGRIYSYFLTGGTRLYRKGELEKLS